MRWASARKFVAREMCLSLAGPLAQAMHGNWKSYTKTARGTNDEAYAMEITWGIEIDDAGRFGWVDRVREISRAIFEVPEVWGTVQDVAQRLLQSAILTGTQVREIVRERIPLAPQADERYSCNESRWCHTEDARLRAAGQRACPKNTHNTLSCESVLARLLQ